MNDDGRLHSARANNVTRRAPYHRQATTLSARPAYTPFTGWVPPRAGAARRACQRLIELELELHALERAEPRGRELADVLALVRDRLELHHFGPHGPVLEEWAA